MVLRRTDEILPDEADPDRAAVERLGALHERYGFEIDPGSVPPLIERHGLEP
nr:hypothetical protein [Salinigranum marinum]